MKDIEELCNRIIIIDKGKILYDGSLANIKYRFGNTKTVFIPSNIELNETELQEKFNGVTFEKQDDKTAIKFSLNDIDLDDMLLYLINTYHIKDFKIEDISIEDITKKLYEKH
jgi:ABC-2 type transport system ATP-binding protein